jgi:biotin carboxyl carrier protein
VLAAPNAVALVSAPLSARVLRVYVRPGQRVAQGEPLVELVMPELIRAAGTLRASDIKLAALSQRHARLLPLLVQGLARTAEVSELESAIATLRAERESARSTLRSAGEPDARAAALVEGHGASVLRAPVAGMVVSVSAQLGQVREPAGGPLLELISDAAPQIEARFSVEPEPQVGFEWVEPGHTIPLLLDAVSPRAGATDGTRLAWLHVAPGAVPPVLGALGRVRMIAPAGWLVVPIRALATRADVHEVRVQKEVGSRALRVTLVRQSESEAVITGLAAGTLVAADAALAGELTP